MLEKLEDIKKKYDSLNEELMNPENVNDIKKMTLLSKERSHYDEIMTKYERYKDLLKSIEDLKEMVTDKEIGPIAKEELEETIKEQEKTERELEILLVPKDEDDEKNVIMEIRGAAGGSEANIFAGDLYEMYARYIDNMGWEHEVINSVQNESGGYSQIEFIVKGKSVYSKLKYESGSHRVQRVPATESQGRIHTSTATVMVMPEQEDIELDIKEQDLKVDVYRSGGAGGQSVNTTDSAVRITHIPTGTVVTCQNERSQIKNREIALQILKNRLHEAAIRKKEEETSQSRRIKIGTGDRSEKIRTYNYPQNRITDHRINLTTMNLDRVMEGKLEDIIEPLREEDAKRKLEEN